MAIGQMVKVHAKSITKRCMIKYILLTILTLFIILLILFINKKREMTKCYTNLIWFESVVNTSTNSQIKDLKIKSFVWNNMENIKYCKTSLIGNAICDHIERNWPLASKTFRETSSFDFSDIPELKIARFRQ